MATRKQLNIRFTLDRAARVEKAREFLLQELARAKPHWDGSHYGMYVERMESVREGSPSMITALCLEYVAAVADDREWA